MLKSKKKLLLILCITIMVIACGILLFKFGWRLMGLRGCDRPSSLLMTAVFEDNTVKVTGDTVNSAFGFDGYVTRVKDDTLYVGCKTRFFWATGGPMPYEIPVDDSIKKVVLSNGDHEKDKLLAERD